MGNKIARTTQASASDFYLHDLPSSYNLVLKEVLCRGRFFKSIQCKHDEGIVLVKVYFKRGDFIDLREYERRLIQVRDTFRALEHPHVWPFQFWLETDKAAYLLRQYFFNNLHDRLGTRPFLSFVEKKWLAFQLLHALKQSHENGICHGDIKCENVLVTSWNWLYLSDFASFKPTYIPHDDPSDFSFFFDTGGRRLCYLAPERFVEHGNEMQVVQDSLLKNSMDIFSVGCVIAELFLEGQPLFELSQLLAYRRGQYDPSQHLEKIQDSGIRKMILHMIQLDPELRLSAESYLQSYSEVVFPSYFSPFLHNFYSCLGPLIPDTRVAVCQGAFREIHKQMGKNKPEFKGDQQFIYSNDWCTETLQCCDAKTETELMLDFVRDGIELENAVDEFKLLDDIDDLLLNIRHRGNNLHSKPTSVGVHGSLFPQSCSDSVLRFPNAGLLPSMYDIRNYPISSLQNLNLLISEDLHCEPLNEVNMRCEDIVLIASLLCSCIRNVKLPQLRRAAVLLLKSCSFHINDEDRLQRVLPYIVGMLSDPATIVRCAALDTLCDILSLVRDFPPSDAKIFPEYIFPMLSMLPDDPEEPVRICYATNISKLALTAYRFLNYSNRSDERGINDNCQLFQLRRCIADIIQELVMGPKQTPNIRRALLQDIGKLCCFFGQIQSNDFLLPILPAFLNDRDEQLRSVFYHQIVYVCFFVGKISVEEYLLPYIDQALGDGVEAVNVNALDCLTVLCRREFLQKRMLLEMIGRAVLLLCYPSQWVRRSAVTFVAASSASLGPVDSYVYLAPIVHPFLRRRPSSLKSEDTLLSCLKPPVSKQIFYQVLEKSRCSDMLGRQRKIWYNQSLQTKRWEAVDMVERELRPVGTLVKGHNPQYKKPIENAMQQLDLSAHTNMASLTAGSSPVHFHEIMGSQKLQTSGGLSFIISKSSEDIPVYSFSRGYGGSGAARISSSMPWIDAPSKNFNMASSDPAPKLVSDSFRILNGSKQFVRVVHEPEIIEDSDVIHDAGASAINQNRNVTVGDTLSNDDNGLCSFTRSPVLDSRWRPRGVLVAHLPEHRSAVNDVAISADHGFFVTASDDSSVKVWDCRRLEKDISFRSRLTYSLEGARALCATMIRDSAQVVVGACDGTLHLFSVDCLKRGIGIMAGKYTGIVDVKRRDAGEGAITSLSNFSSRGATHEMLIFSTKNCGIHLWDTRTSSSAWKLKAPADEGYASSIVIGSSWNWFVSGSSRGFLTLWDLRFLVPVNAWQYSRACVIEKTCLFIPLPNTSQSTTARPLIYVSAGCNEVSLWNAENGSCHQIFRVAGNSDTDTEMSEFPWALARHPSKHYPKLEINQHANPKYRGDELTEPLPRLPGIRAMFALPGGDLLTGGTDLKIRRWDHYSPDKSYCICGPSIKGAANEFYEARSSFGVQVVQEIQKPLSVGRPSAKSVLAAAAVDSVGCHRDAILAMASVKLNQQLLISSSRDGAVKVWR